MPSNEIALLRLHPAVFHFLFLFLNVLAIKMLIISLSFRLTRCTQRQFSPKCIKNTFQAIQSTFRP